MFSVESNIHVWKNEINNSLKNANFLMDQFILKHTHTHTHIVWTHLFEQRQVLVFNIYDSIH